jgi:ATP synthase protein I
VTAAAAAIMVALCASFGGQKGALAGLIATGIVAGFFGLSVLVVGRAAKISPQAMMLAGIVTYLVKILVLLILVGQFQNSAAFSARLFGLTAIILVLVYTAAQVLWSMRIKTLYVDPDGER